MSGHTFTKKKTFKTAFLQKYFIRMKWYKQPFHPLLFFILDFEINFDETELRTLELWISRSMLDKLFFIISRLI